MPDIIKLYIRSTIIGFVLSAVFVALILWQNVGNLGYLVTHTADGPLAVFLLFFFNGLVFSGAQTAVAVLLMAEDEDTPRGPRGNAPESALVPIPVRTSRDRS